MNTKALQWIAGSDTGTSSKTLWAVMMGAVADGERYDRPYDGSDFGRCHRLLELVPDWKTRISEVAARFPEWAPLVREWSKIEKAYLADLKDNGDRSWKIISGLNDECMKAGGWKKNGSVLVESNRTMTATDLIQCAFVGVFIAAASGIYCFARGRAFGWQEGFFEREAAERRKRDSQGKFKHVET